MNAHTSQASATPARIVRRIARLQRGLRRAEDISEWNRLQAELHELTTQHLRIVEVH